MNFCSRLARESGEPLAGTAVQGGAFVFLPVDKKLWQASEINAHWATPAEIEILREARRGGVVTRLYNPAADGAAPVVHVAPGRAPPEALAAVLEMAAPRWGAPAPPTPRIAICTHGTRDRCCAKWGFAAFREAARLYREGASALEPLECSHLGGDRFAATGIVFPSGGMYGRLDSVGLARLAEAEAARRILPEAYRGCVFEPPVVQVIRAGLARDGLLNDSAVALDAQPDEEAPGKVTVTAADTRFQVSLSRVEVDFIGSCKHADRGRRSRQTRWRYVAARPL